MKYYQASDKQDYLRDESRMTGSADVVCFPESEADIVSLLQKDPSRSVTISGSRTGLTGGCVPQGGIVMSTERLKMLSVSPDSKTASCGPGVTLLRLQDLLTGSGSFFAPDPTEPTCSIGGMIACNASGARTYRYGATRNHILRLRIVLSSGDILEIRRGEHFASGRHFSLQPESGTRIQGTLPDVPMPRTSKHAAGYWIRPDMDMIDLFIGSEGTLGIVTEADLLLTPAAKHRWGALYYFDREDEALEFVRLVRAEDRNACSPMEAAGTHNACLPAEGNCSHTPGLSAEGNCSHTSGLPAEGNCSHTPGLSTEAIEFFGADALALLAQMQASGRIHIDDALLPKEPCCAVYTEHTGKDTAFLTDIYRRISSLLTASGGSPRRSCAAVSAPALAGLRAFRHAVPESVNMQIADLKKQVPNTSKIAADICVPDEALADMLALYRSTLTEAGLSSAIFGHIGNSHLHANIIPRSEEELAAGRALLARWAAAGAACGGSVSAEHGIGKLKRPLLALQYPQAVLAEMFELKRLFDPALRLNPGNLFD